MKKIVTVLGARPQFVKASVVTKTIMQTSGLSEVVVHTGQHFDANMSDIFFSELGMAKPDFFLGINSGKHGMMTGRMLEQVEKVLIAEKPDVVLVYGDTNSTLAGSLAAAKLQIPVAHVEAGLRSFNMAMPEEINRILTDRVSHWLFAPTDSAAQHLKREGFLAERVSVVGDVMYDVALHYSKHIDPGSGLLGRLGIAPQAYVLATVHRAENTDHPARLAAIVNGLIATAQKIPVIWPLHPRTRKVLRQAGLLDDLVSCVTLIDPVGYLDMIQLEKFAALIATDSGGVQKEAFFFSVPCVTLRDETEWFELVEAGWNTLVPPADGLTLFHVLMNSIGTKGLAINPYGNGDSARLIISKIFEDIQ